MRKTLLNFKFPVSIFKEGKYFVAHTPALDLSTSGKSYEEVKRRFTEIVNIFFEETFKKGTLNTILQDLGWQKTQNELRPPALISHSVENVQVLVRR